MKIYRVISDPVIQSLENTKDAFYSNFYEIYNPRHDRYFTDLNEAKSFYDSIILDKTKKYRGSPVYLYSAKMLLVTNINDDSAAETLEDLYDYDTDKEITDADILEALYDSDICGDVLFFDSSDLYLDPELDEDDDDDDKQD